MGCGCGSASPARRVQLKTNGPGKVDQPQGKEPGAWVAVYSDGSERVFVGAQARREAMRRALSGGGRFYQVPE